MRPLLTRFIAGMIGILISFCATHALLAADIALQCDTCRYVVDSTGRNVAFVDLSDGKNYLKTGEASGFCASVVQKEKTFVPTSAAFAGNVLTLKFDSCGVVAKVKVTNEKTRLVFEVLNVQGEAESFVFINVPLTLRALPLEKFAACSLSLNLHTHVHELPALQRNLWAACYKRFEFKGARAALVGVPQKDILPVIRDIMTKAVPDVPFCDQGGAWAMQAKEGHGSYLINTGDLTEKTVDDWIKYCKQYGFNQIDNHGSASFFLFGSFELDKKKFPQGWKSFKNVTDKLHAAGISSILHTYTCYITKNSKYVTPVPHPDLDILQRFTLAANVDEKATEIIVNETTKDVSTRIGYMETSSRTLRMGDEIIEYTDVTREAPYKFIGCKRGFHGTKIASHQAGSAAGVLKTFWYGMYVPEPHSALFDEIAHNTAKIVDECGFDGVYLDAIEGLQYMWGKENYWYYGDKFVFEVMKSLKKPVGLEYAGMIHHWWHFRSRYQAWDMVSRGYKRFMDVRIASMKAGEEYQHGSWGGYWPEIEKYGQMKDCGLYLPLQLGWWRFNMWRSPKQDIMFNDDIEYVCNKLLGNNAGFSMIGIISDHLQAEAPIYREFIDTIRTYEQLRHQQYFNEDVCKLLRHPGKEYSLFKAADGKWNFKPVFYKKHKVEGLNHESASWKVSNEYADQPIWLRIEALMSAIDDGNPAGMNIFATDAASIAPFKTVRTAPGVSMAIKASDVKVPATGQTAFELTAQSNGTSTQKGTWGCVAQTFEKPLNLGNRTTFGVWIKGDAGGELIDVKLCSGGAGMALMQSSHYINVDFSGWKYFTFVEPESTRITDYRWPVLSKYYVYDNHIGYANPASIAAVEFWVNNLPAKKQVSCLIGPLVAMKAVPTTFDSPTVTVNGQKLTFPVKMTSGMYLELNRQGKSRLVGPTGTILQEIAVVGAVPTFKSGENTISFSATTSDQCPVRAQVTVSAQGKPLKQQ